MPQRIRDAVDGWNDERLHVAPRASAASTREEGVWSAAEILAHIRASDDILAYRVYAMLARDEPPLPMFDERRWAEVAGYPQMDFWPSIETFSRRREELVLLLRRLSPEDWERTGAHEGRGRVTLREVVSMLVDHEEEHTSQIEALAGQSVE